MARRWLTGRVALGLAALPLTTMLTVCGVSSYRIHRANASVQSHPLPTRPAPGPGARILVLAPHCDDETLGVGGTMAQAVANGARVRVAVLTNGDGFPVAATRHAMRLAPGPDTFIQLAKVRQKETVAALRALGLRSRDVTFLGYPDRGLSRMWSRHWEREDPYRSPYTRQDHSPYRNSYQRNAPYAGESLLGDLMRLIAAERPTELILPDPGDDHPDHWATYCFGTAALEALRSRAESAPAGTRPLLSTRPSGDAAGSPAWARDVAVRTYLIHRGDWPVPQGLHREARLVPPASLLHVDTRWDIVPLSPRDEERKRAAIQCYRSQTAVMRRFLTSFIRKDELFGRLPEIRLAPEAAPVLTSGGLPSDWRQGGARMVDASGDNVIRQLRPSADLMTLDAQCDRDTVYLRLGARDPLSTRIEYRLHLQPVATKDGPAGPPVVLSSRDQQRGTLDLAGHLSGSGWQVAIPRKRLGDPQRLLVGADSRFGDVVFDRLSWRVLTLPRPRVETLHARGGGWEASGSADAVGGRPAAIRTVAHILCLHDQTQRLLGGRYDDAACGRPSAHVECGALRRFPTRCRTHLTVREPGF